MAIRKITYLVVSLVFVLSTVHSQPTVTVSATGNSLNPSLMGLNGRSTEGPSWTDATFNANVQEMNPAFVRYPAGTQGNQWNWKTGTFIASLGMNAQEIFTIPMFVNGLPQGAKIIYMVNMVLPTEQTGLTFTTTTDSHLSSDNTLTLKITDILNALDAFDKAGHLPEICELGNELYFSNVYAGVYANNPTFYMQHAKIIALAIKNKYPAMKIILCTTKGGTTSRDNWNTLVFNTINNDAQLRTAVFGVVQHHYINETYGNLSAVTDNAMAKIMIDEGITYLKDIASDYTNVPSTLKIWVTEYGATKASADGMWCSGLRLATMSLSFMKMGPKIDNLLWHHITDDPNILSATKSKLGPAGIVFSLLTKVMNGASSYKNLTFNNMQVTNDYAGLTGYKFFAEGTENILVLNTENTNYTGVNLSGLTGNGTMQFVKQYWSGTPYQRDVTPTSNISVNNAVNLSTYTINPFSITVFSKKINTANTEIISKNEVKVYPTLIEQELYIDCAEATNFTIQDISGRVNSTGKLTAGKNLIDASHFSKGIKLLIIGNKHFKVLKK